MALDRETVRNIAFLARVRVEEDALEPLAKELSGILGWVEQLAKVATEGIAPMTSVAAMTLPQRADAVSDGNCRTAILANAPEAEDGFFAVPKVVE